MAEQGKWGWVVWTVLGCGTVVFLALLVGGTLAYRWFNDPEQQAAFSAVMETGQRPGSTEIRGTGCDHGIIMTIEDIQLLARTFGAEEGELTDLPAELMVICRLEPRTEAEPTCEEVARAYVAGAPDAPETFFVQVQRQRLPRPERLCEGIHDREGVRVAEAELDPTRAP